MKLIDQIFLKRCLYLAKQGGTEVCLNPLVGAVIVHNEQIIGEGFHQIYGGPHAEVEAVNSVSDLSLLSKSTIYVSLEPCNHFGNTPPCVDLILKNKIPRVVIGCLDPNPKVAGKGMARLQEGGVEVELSTNQAPFIDINKAFFINQLKKRPFITLKWAETTDRFMAGIDINNQAYPIPITSHEANTVVHRLRSSHQGIMIGRNTASIDNPRLTTRLFPGNDPIRIVLDRKLKLPKDLNLFTDRGKTIVLSEKKKKGSATVSYFDPEEWNDLEKMMQNLYQEKKISSILIEGGANLHQQFLDQGIYDEIFVFRSTKKIGTGMAAPIFSGNLNRVKQLGPDELFFFSR